MTADRTPHQGPNDQRFHNLLSGDPSALPALSRWFRRMPSPPRCKGCGAPFSGPFTPALKLLGFKPWPLNQQLCSPCYQGMGRHPGGAEVPVSLLFTDVRGSTALAEQMSAGEFHSLIDRFFKTVFTAVDAEAGVIDHIVGDGVMAMWTPGWSGPHHALRTVEAGRSLIQSLAGDPELGHSFPAGVGVHFGEAWIGVVGQIGAHDFTVLGDAPNTAARLGSSAQAGELVMSDAIVEAAGIDTSILERRTLQLKGKSRPFEAWIEVRLAV